MLLFLHYRWLHHKGPYDFVCGCRSLRLREDLMPCQSFFHRGCCNQRKYLRWKERGQVLLLLTAGHAYLLIYLPMLSTTYHTHHLSLSHAVQDGISTIFDAHDLTSSITSPPLLDPSACMHTNHLIQRGGDQQLNEKDLQMIAFRQTHHA